MRILLIEDHPIVRAGCRRLLDVILEVEIAEAATATDGLRMAHEFLPDIIVLDLNLPDGNGLDLLGPLMSHASDPKIIVFSMYEDPVFAARALEAGATGYMTKNDDPDVLLQAIDKVGAGGVFLTASMAEKLALMAVGPRDDPLQDLSSRERRVLELLGLGRTLGEIADELKVSYRTSANIAAQIKTKLKVTSTPALVKWAVDHSRLPSNAR
jgi:DNA-binding NarL/FixJ family response regulator